MFTLFIYLPLIFIQVQELHRLHRMQNSLMKHSVWKELNGYHLWEMSMQSTLGPFINPTRYSPQVEDKSFYSSPMVNDHNLQLSTMPMSSVESFGFSSLKKSKRNRIFFTVFSYLFSLVCECPFDNLSLVATWNASFCFGTILFFVSWYGL